jgi:uncharacterized protein YjdB
MKKYFLFSGLLVLFCLTISCKSPSSSSTPTPTPTSVAITSPDSEIWVGQTEQMTATVTMSNGSTKAATGTWGSDNTSVASVNQSGLVTGVGAGSANIYMDATGVEGLDTMESTAAPDNVDVTGDTTDTQNVGATGDTTNTKNPAVTGGLLGIKEYRASGSVHGQMKFRSTDDSTGIENLDATGGLHSLNNFGATNNANGIENVAPMTTVRGSKTLTVKALTVKNVDVTSPDSEIVVGQTEQMTATVTMSDGSTKAGTGTWSSGNTYVATVDQSSGVVNGIGAGVVDVIFTNTGGKQGRKTLTVRNVWSMSGVGDDVFDMPTYVSRVKITGTYTGYSSNFIVHIGGDHIVNELLGTDWGQTYFSGTYITTGGVVEILYSSGVSWSFTEVPVTAEISNTAGNIPNFKGKSVSGNREYEIYEREAAKNRR